MTPAAVLVASLVQHTYHSRTGHVAVVSGYALVEWLHPPVFGHTVGNAVLEKRGGAWHIIAAGGSPYESRLLTDFGVPPAVARALVEKLH